MKIFAVIAAVMVTAACSPQQVEMADLVGRWTWDGYECTRTNLEIGGETIIFTAEDGERGSLFRLHDGPHYTGNPEEYILHLELQPHDSMTAGEQEALRSGRGRYALLLKLSGDRITPIMTAHEGRSRPLRSSDHTFGLFSVRRCA